jgi:hypothetical protein
MILKSILKIQGVRGRVKINRIRSGSSDKLSWKLKLNSRSMKSEEKLVEINSHSYPKTDYVIQLNNYSEYHFKFGVGKSDFLNAAGDIWINLQDNKNCMISLHASSILLLSKSSLASPYFEKWNNYFMSYWRRVKKLCFMNYVWNFSRSCVRHMKIRLFLILGPTSVQWA